MPPPPSEQDTAARLAALQAHPDLARLLARTPAFQAKGTTSTTFLVVTLAAGSLVTLAFSVFAFFLCAPLGILPLVSFGVFAFYLLGQSREGASLAKVPVEQRAVVVIDERTSVGEGRGGARRYVTLEDANGRREEVTTSGEANDLAHVGDAGVAYLKGRMLYAFERLSV